MPIYQVLNQTKLIELADKRGWIDDSSDKNIWLDNLPSVEFFSSKSGGLLHELNVENHASILIRIPNAIMHGGNFSLIIEDKIFPGGFAHSFVPSSLWKQVDNDHVSYQPTKLRHITEKNPALLGLTCHWGHFFVDALDRLLTLEKHNLLDSALLVGDPDFFGLHPSVDEYHSISQVSEVIRLLGIHLNSNNVIPIFKQYDYHVTNLSLCTLESTKPSISANSFRKIRQRLSAHLNTISGDTETLIFIGRSDIKKRFILNQQSIVDYLRDTRKALTIFPEFISAEEAIQIFSSASRVILPIGSAKFNLAFCKPGSKIICITPEGYASNSSGIVIMVRHMCHALGLKLAFYDVAIEERKPLVNSNLIITKTDIENIMRIFDMMA